MQVTHLFNKLDNSIIIECNQLNCESYYGILQSKYYSNLSPRQILIVSQHDIDTFNLKPSDLKENIVLDSDISHIKSGDELVIGDVGIRITFLCEPCSYIDSLTPGLAKKMIGRRGLLGRITRSGSIYIGDVVHIDKQIFEEIPYKVFDRFNWLLNKLPNGKLITYTQIIKTLGLFSVYYRVLPSYIKKCNHNNCYNILDSKFKTLEYFPEQLEILKSQNMDTENLKKYIWDTSTVYN